MPDNPAPRVEQHDNPHIAEVEGSSRPTRASWKLIGWLGLLLFATGVLLGVIDGALTFREVAMDQPTHALRFGFLTGALMTLGLALLVIVGGKTLWAKLRH